MYTVWPEEPNEFTLLHCTLYSTEPSVVKRMLYNYSRCMKKIKSVLYSHNTCIIQYELKVILEAVRKIACVFSMHLRVVAPVASWTNIC